MRAWIVRLMVKLAHLLQPQIKADAQEAVVRVKDLIDDREMTLAHLTRSLSNMVLAKQAIAIKDSKAAEALAMMSQAASIMQDAVNSLLEGKRWQFTENVGARPDFAARAISGVIAASQPVATRS